MSTIYLFDGSGGCDYCVGATGYTIDEEPIRPHAFCDCPIYVIDTEDMADCEMVLVDLIVDEYDFVQQSRVVANGCAEDTETDMEFDIDEDVQEGFDEGLRELVEAAGWAPPASEHLSGTITLEEGWIHTIDLSITRRVAMFEAEVAYECTVGNWIVTIPGGQKTGFFETNYRLEIERDSQRCDDNPEGIDVPDLADDEALASYLGEDDEETG